MAFVENPENVVELVGVRVDVTVIFGQTKDGQTVMQFGGARSSADGVEILAVEETMALLLRGIGIHLDSIAQAKKPKSNILLPLGATRH